jgi:hypothetical protein
LGISPRLRHRQVGSGGHGFGVVRAEQPLHVGDDPFAITPARRAAAMCTDKGVPARVLINPVDGQAVLHVSAGQLAR